MNGFLLIDKEKGLNSFKLVVIVRKLSGQKRVGFAGTLDPLASGLMILALGEYTKLLPYLEAKDKVYQVKILLGKISDTYDAEGQIERYVGSKIPSFEQIEKLLHVNFEGKIEQQPPRFSAIQINGKRAYDLARKGLQFELKPRGVQIFYTKILSYQYPELDLEVHCSSGTYIRSLAHDLGKRLECGGLVQELRRIRIGNLDVSNSLTLEQLKSDDLNKLFVPWQKTLEERSKIALDQKQYEILAKGNFIDNDWQLESEALGSYKDQVVGVIETIEEGRKLKFRKKLHIF